MTFRTVLIVVCPPYLEKCLLVFNYLQDIIVYEYLGRMSIMSRILIKNGTLVTMNQERAVFEGDLFIEGKRIAALSPSFKSNPEAGYPGFATEPSSTPSEFRNVDKIIQQPPDAYDYIIDAAGKVILPGLVQGHVHLCQTLFRGLADDLELLDWLRLRIWPMEAAHDPESLYYAALLGCAELLRGGTTCIMDMETVHHTEAAIEALVTSGIRAVTGKVMMDRGLGVPEGLMENAADSVQETIRLLQKWHGYDEGRIRYAFQPRFAVSCSDELLRQVAKLAREYGVMIHTHASESQGELELVQRQTGMRNIVYLNEVGLTGPDVLLAHCIWLDDMEIGILQDTGTRVVHCPSSNLKLGSGIAPVPELLDRGITVALGADGAPCGNNLDGFMEMRLAALIHKVRYGPTVMPAPLVLEMATRQGARALSQEDEIGSLEPGKRADLIILNLNQAHCYPASGIDIASRLVYAAKTSDVETTIVDGQVVMLERKLLTINEAEARERCDRIVRTRFSRLVAK